jgi:hypothetical protein
MDDGKGQSSRARYLLFNILLNIMKQNLVNMAYYVFCTFHFSMVVWHMYVMSLWMSHEHVVPSIMI